MTQMSRDGFELLVRRSGLVLSPAEIDGLYTAWPLLQPLLDRVRGMGRDRPVPPANVFRPDAYFDEGGA